MLDSLSELGSGKVFHGRYEVVRCISAGGMGAVYEVVHLETKRRRALKVMLPSIVRDAGMRGRFRQEAQITAEVESDHIVETFDAGVDPETGAPFLVMEMLRGEDLAHHLHAAGPMPPSEVLGVLHQLGRALEATHARGIVHRDLKPENLFLAVRGDDPPRLKVLDFGIAKVVAQSTQAQGGTQSLGTPLYMAPEQLEGAEVSGRTDLFAVGHIAFTLLAGRPYWTEEAESIAGILPLVARIARGPEEPASKRAARMGVILPAAFDGWFTKATAHAPGDRFQRAADQVGALAAALGVSLSNAAIPAPALGSATRPAVADRASPPPEVDTVLAPTTASEASGAHGTSGLAASLLLAPLPAGGAGAGAQTHHASVASIPDVSPRPARTRVIAFVAVSAVIAASAIGIRLFVSHGDGPAPPEAVGPTARGPSAAPASPPAGGPAVEPASAAPPAPPVPPAVPVTASAAPPASPSSPAPHASGAPRSSPHPAGDRPKGPRKPSADPTRVFD